MTRKIFTIFVCDSTSSTSPAKSDLLSLTVLANVVCALAFLEICKCDLADLELVQGPRNVIQKHFPPTVTCMHFHRNVRQFTHSGLHGEHCLRASPAPVSANRHQFLMFKIEFSCNSYKMPEQLLRISSYLRHNTIYFLVPHWIILWLLFCLRCWSLRWVHRTSSPLSPQKCICRP